MRVFSILLRYDDYIYYIDLANCRSEKTMWSSTTGSAEETVLLVVHTSIHHTNRIFEAYFNNIIISHRTVVMLVYLFGR